MYSRQVKIGVFLLEGLNAVATTYYFYYAYFFMRDQFGFGTMQNLILAGGLGFIYLFAAIFGGRFGQRHGYFLSLKVGFIILAVAIGFGSLLSSAPAHIGVMIAGNIGMCFTWPALQSIISDKEDSKKLQSLTGIYNLTWAAGSACAYFAGGAAIKMLGQKSMFLVPSAIHLLQLAMTFWLESKAIKGRRHSESQISSSQNQSSTASAAGKGIIVLDPKAFLKMAWLANPFAYLAINTIVAVMPTVAGKLNLSLKFTGFFCSVWLFVRAASFVFLRSWTAWHYRFRWLVSAYIAMIASFAGILMTTNLWLLIGAQIVFGVAISLIYYSSLFYSMDVSETKGHNAGFHEGMIGLGSGSGPAIGASALYLFPQVPNSSAYAVSGLLVFGLGGLLWLRMTARRHT